MAPPKRTNSKQRTTPSAAAESNPPPALGKRFFLVIGLTITVLLAFGTGAGLWLENRSSKPNSSAPRSKYADRSDAVSSENQSQPSLAEATQSELESLLKLPSLSPEETTLTGDDNFWSVQLEKALQDLQDNYPDDPRAEHLYGLVQLRLKRTKLAEPSLRRCVAMAPSDLQMRCDLAELLLQQGRDEEAFGVLSLPDGVTHPTLAYLSILGDCQQHLGRLEDSEVTLTAATKHTASTAAVWVKLGNVQLQQRKLKEAETSARKAIQLDSNDAAAWLLLNESLVLSKQPKEAAVALRHWQELAKQPEESATAEDAFAREYSQAKLKLIAGSFRSMAALYQSKQNLSAARTMIEQALKVAPRDALVLASRAALLRAAGDFESAIETTRQLVQLQPTEAAYYQNLANLMMETNQPSAAEAALRLACLRLPSHAGAQLSLARILLFLNKPREAIAHAQLAVQLSSSVEAADTLAQALEAANVSFQNGM